MIIIIQDYAYYPYKDSLNTLTGELMNCPSCHQPMDFSNDPLTIANHKLDACFKCQCQNSFPVTIGYKNLLLNYYSLPLNSNNRVFWVKGSKSKERTDLFSSEGYPLLSLPQFIQLEPNYQDNLIKILELDAFA